MGDLERRALADGRERKSGMMKNSGGGLAVLEAEVPEMVGLLRMLLM
jgi:hypothetical protein